MCRGWSTQFRQLWRQPLLPVPCFPMRIILLMRVSHVLAWCLMHMHHAPTHWSCDCLAGIALCGAPQACCFTCTWVGVLCNCSSPSLLAALPAYWLLDWCFVTIVLYPSSRQFQSVGVCSSWCQCFCFQVGVSAALQSTLYRPCALFSQCHSSLLLPDTSRATEVVVAGVMPVRPRTRAEHRTSLHCLCCPAYFALLGKTPCG